MVAAPCAALVEYAMRIARLPLSSFLACAMLATLASCGGGGTSAAGAGNSAIVTMVTTSVPDTQTGQPYTAQFEASFPHSPGVFQVTSGALPPGLALEKATGQLTGYARQTGVFHFEIAARDGADEVPLGGNLPAGRDASFAEDRKSFALTVALGPPHILPQTIPAAQYRASYAYPIDVAGGTAPYGFAETNGPNLPKGLAISPKGVLGVFPVQARQAPYDFEVTVTDAQGLTDTASMSVLVLVLPLIFLTADPIPEAAVGFPYDIPLDLASGGAGQPYTWSQIPPVAGETSLSTIGMEVGSNGHVHDLGAGPLSVGTFKFTAGVTDEIGQLATQHFTLKVNPGPVLTSITPNRSSTPGPYTAKGLNFQPGAKLYFKPGPTQTLVSTTFVDATTLTFAGPAPKPSDGSGAVDVRVVNPDGGAHTKASAFIFPATTISFGGKGFISSALSSTGLDAADADGDGKPDLVHCGAASYQATPGGTTSSASGGGLVYMRNLGTVPPTFGAQTLSSGSFTDVKFADVNNDGRPDIVGLGQSTIQVWLNSVSGFTSSAIVSTLYTAGTSVYWPSEMAIGKLNSDGLLDIVYGAVYYNSGGYTSGRCFSMAGNGSGSFSPLDAALSSMSASSQSGYTMGIHVVGCLDLNGDGRSEVVAGTGMGYYNGTYPLLYSVTGSTGLFGSWDQKGNQIASPQYPGMQGLALGDFLGIGSTQVIVGATGATNYSNTSSLFLLSGAALTTSTSIASPGAKTKSICSADLDFDAKIDWAVTTNPSSIAVYKGGTQTNVVSLDASTGSPSIASPRTGRIVAADIDGDGRPDLIATCSYWAGEGMGAWQNGTYYALGMNGDGGQMGLVFYLNTSN